VGNQTLAESYDDHRVRGIARRRLTFGKAYLAVRAGVLAAAVVLATARCGSVVDVDGGDGSPGTSTQAFATTREWPRS
jgi:hypothetical protein